MSDVALSQCVSQLRGIREELKNQNIALWVLIELLSKRDGLSADIPERYAQDAQSLPQPQTPSSEVK